MQEPIPEIVLEAIEGLEARLSGFRRMKGHTRHWRNEDQFYTQVLIDYVRYQENQKEILRIKENKNER